MIEQTRTHSVIMEKTPKNLAEASEEVRKQFLNSFDTVLFDCDGVLWSLLSKPVEGAEDAVKALEEIEKEFFFLSNNATRSNKELEEKFKSFQVKLDLDIQFLTLANSLVDYLKGINFEKSIYLIGSPILAERLRKNNYDVIMGPDVVEDRMYTKELMTVHPNVGAIVFDSDINLNLIKIHKAEMLLLDPRVLLIFGATETQYDLGKVHLSAAGKFQKALEDKFQRKPIILGKPGAELGQFIAKKFADKKVLFVGDNMETDIGFANKLGFQSLLVFTGCTTKETLQKHQKAGEMPDYYLESIAQLAEVIGNV